jgi:hypothetical protein
MDKQMILQHKSTFDSITQYINSDDKSEQIEIWFARDLQAVLGYSRWENFAVAIQRAVDSCKTQNVNVDDHFREVTKMIELGKGGKREVLGKRGIKPEELPPAEDIKKLERRVATEEKVIEKTTQKLPKK